MRDVAAQEEQGWSLVRLGGAATYDSLCTAEDAAIAQRCQFATTAPSAAATITTASIGGCVPRMLPLGTGRKHDCQSKHLSTRLLWRRGR